MWWCVFGTDEFVPLGCTWAADANPSATNPLCRDLDSLSFLHSLLLPVWWQLIPAFMQRAIKKKVCTYWQKGVYLGNDSMKSKLPWRLITSSQCLYYSYFQLGGNPSLFDSCHLQCQVSDLFHPVLSYFWQIPLLQFSHPWQLQQLQVDFSLPGSAMQRKKKGDSFSWWHHLVWQGSLEVTQTW